MINKELEFKVKGNVYKIKFPNVGEYIDIQTMKMSLSRNQYGSMERAFLPSMQRALNMVDIESILTVLCPDLVKNLVPEGFSKLGLKDYKELEGAYSEQIVPWWKEIEDIFTPEKEEKKTEDSN